jgi:hypothetical protein
MTNEEIIQRHYVAYKTVDCLVFEPTKVEKILISFTGMQRGHFNKWSWYHHEHQKDTSILFIVFRDDEHLYFLDRPRKTYVDDHLEFINQKINQHGLTSKDVYTTGSSMGGYAAVYYAFLLNANIAIASVPMVDYKSAELIKPWTLWTRQMSAVGEYWVDLNDFILTQSSTTDVYIIHGQFEADVNAVDNLIKSLEKLGIRYERDVVDGETHYEYLTLDKLMSIINNGITTQKIE